MDELSLIQEAAYGSVESFNTLVLTYQSSAYNLAYRLMGDADSAADATQEAFIAAFKSLNQYHGGSFKAWLMRIVTNQCYDELRRRKRRPAVSIEDFSGDSPDGDHLPRLVSDPDETPEALMMRGALNRAIQDCLDALPHAYRLVAVLADVQEYDYREIADIARVSLGTVKSRLSRARQRLRDCLQGARELLPTQYRLNSSTESED